MTVINDLLDEVWATWDSLVEAYRVYFPEPPKPKPRPKDTGIHSIVSGSFTTIIEPGLREEWLDDPRNAGPNYPGKIWYVDK